MGPGRDPRFSTLVARLAAAVAAGVLAGCARPPERPTETLGPWAVGFRRAEATDEARGGRRLPLAVWYPVEPGRAGARRARYTCFEHPLLTIAVRSDVAVSDAPVAGGRRWPLIVFSHGSPSLETQSPNYTETLASHGFVVVAPRHVGSSIFETHADAVAAAEVQRRGTEGEATLGGCEVIAAALRGEPWALEVAGDPAHVNIARPFDVWLVIHWAAAQARRPGSFLRGAVDAERVGVTGHSSGGCTALAAAAGYGERPPDPRIKAVVPVAAAGTALLPDDVLRTVVAPALFVHGGRDPKVPWRDAAGRACELIASPSPTIVRIRDAGHCCFADIDGFAHAVKRLGLYPWTWRWVGGRRLLKAYREVHADGMLPAYEAQRLLNHYAAAFFRRHLHGDLGAEAVLLGARDEPLVEVLAPPFPAREARPGRPASRRPAPDVPSRQMACGDPAAYGSRTSP